MVPGSFQKPRPQIVPIPLMEVKVSRPMTSRRQEQAVPTMQEEVSVVTKQTVASR